MSCDIIQWSRHHRCLPGDGSFDLQGFLRRPMRNGYRGLLSLEVFSDQINIENPAAVAARGYRSLCELEYSTRRTLATVSAPERLAS
jgi:4-hydroxyphenylpyruvate dioxygenase